MLPEGVKEELADRIARLKLQHAGDLKAGNGHTTLPYA